MTASREKRSDVAWTVGGAVLLPIPLLALGAVLLKALSISLQQPIFTGLLLPIWIVVCAATGHKRLARIRPSGCITILYFFGMIALLIVCTFLVFGYGFDDWL